MKFRLRDFVLEAHRRRVFRTAGLYIVGVWAALQVAALAFESFGIPGVAMRFLWQAAVVLFPLVLVFGWRYDLTLDGITRTAPARSGEIPDLTLRKPDYVILAALFVATLSVIGSSMNIVREKTLTESNPWYAARQIATTIAVLPLENLSGDESQDFLADGLHDALITTLSRITRFRVTSRFSTRQVRSAESLADISRLLGVSKVLSGSVMREQEQVRVNVSLVDTETETTIWSDSFTRSFDGLIDMQNEIASTVAREVKLQLNPEEMRLLASANSPAADTYESYLRGMAQLRKGTPRGYRQAIEIFTAALEEDPTSALAYAGLAIGYSQLGHSPFPVDGAYPRAKEAADRAISFDPDLAEAHLAVGMYKIYYEWDFPGGEQSFLRALELNPSLVDAHYHYAWLLELLHRDEEAIRYGEYAKAVNPLSPFYSAWLADQYRDADFYDKAIKEAETTLALNPDYPVAWLTLGQTYADMGRFEEAIEAHEHLRGNSFWGFALASTLATADRNENAEEVLRFVREKTNNAFTLTLIYAGLRDEAETLKWLETARDEHVPWYPWLVTWFSQTEFLRDHPQVREMAADLGLDTDSTTTSD